MTQDDTVPPASPAEPRRLAIEAAPVAIAEAEAAPAAPRVPAPSCETCQGTRVAGDGSPCPGCISLVPRPTTRHAAPLPVLAPEQPDVLPSKAARECEACGAAESPSVPMFDAGYALYCLSGGDCRRRQDAAKAAAKAAAQAPASAA